MVEDLKDRNAIAISEFKNILSHWINAYKSQICSYFAIKSSAGIRLVFGRIIFDTNASRNTHPNFYIETEHIIASHEILMVEPNTIEQRLFEAKEGKVKASAFVLSYIVSKLDSPNERELNIGPDTCQQS